MSSELVLGRSDFEALRTHLFPGDGDEHAAVLGVGWMHSAERTRLLVREVRLVPPDAWLPGTRSYRLIPARFVAETANALSRQRLGYVMVHSHPGAGAFTRLSDDDVQSQMRGYREISSIVNGAPVGGIALGEESFDGLIWGREGVPRRLGAVTVIGMPVEKFDSAIPPGGADTDTEDRARRIFGSAGLARLRGLKVAIIGAGGGGSVLALLLAKLGVGRIVGVDFDRLELANIPRVIGGGLGSALDGRRKLAVMADSVASAGRGTSFEPITGDIYDQDVAWRLRDTDFLFLAGDSMRARSVFNALCHIYLIPGAQIGARVEAPSGRVDLIYAIERLVFPDHGCLRCSGAINETLLHRELLTPDERRAEDYGIPVRATDPIDPNVITLDALGASLAANDFLFTFTGLHRSGVRIDHRHEYVERREVFYETPRRDPACQWCGRGERSAYAVGDSRDLLPCRVSSDGKAHARTND